MSISRAVLVAAATFVTAGTITGCGGGQSPSTTGPTASTNATSVAQGGAGDAPRVPAPLKVDGLAADPCKALAPEQVSQLGMAAPGVRGDTPVGPKCTWSGQAYPTNTMAIGFATANDLGLTNVYRGKSTQAYFEPSTIDGYPTVYAAPSDERAVGTCDLSVGVTDQPRPTGWAEPT